MVRRHGPRRAGITLIEILVVIAIIAVLMGLLLSSVQSVRMSARKTEVGSEISQMANAIGAFKAKYRVDYIPSKIVLRNTLTNYTNGALEQDSLVYIKTLWPRIQDTGLDWAGGVAGTPPFTLEGDQCLVFFLGGIMDANGIPTGFSSNPSNPTAGGTRERPFFEFKTARLKRLHGNSPFASYLDAYSVGGIAERPYLYFSSIPSRPLASRYNPFGTGAYAQNDCATMASTSFTPYQQATSPVRFHQENGFQIVSAGRDRVYGTGGGSTGGADTDNLTNFATGALGGAQ